jgi:Rieske Fe-S protein
MEMNRREFVAATAVACALTCLGEEIVGAAPPAAAPTEPFDAGPLASFDSDKITDTFAAEHRVLLVRADGKLFAPSASCTHKNCKSPLKVKEGGLACSCHGSKFSAAGIVTKGPAKTSLTHYGISVDDKGHVIVDPSKQFGEREWEKAGSFVEIKK